MVRVYLLDGPTEDPKIIIVENWHQELLERLGSRPMLEAMSKRIKASWAKRRKAKG